MSRKLHFTEGSIKDKQSYTLIAKSLPDGKGIDIMTECHASCPFMVTLMSDTLYRMTKSFNQASELICKNAFWLMVKEKVEERLQEDE